MNYAYLHCTSNKCVVILKIIEYTFQNNVYNIHVAFQIENLDIMEVQMFELKDIDVTVKDEHGKDKKILKDINLTVDDNSFVVITGPNGGGKSTLVKVMMGIQQPSAGEVFFEGENITNKSITDRARMGLGFAFQQPVRFKGLFVKDLISIAANRELSTEEACVYLSEVGLCAADYIDRELDDSLSGGELKRIEIAMVLARGSRLSIFDEPEAGIDLWSFKNLINVFENVRKATRGSIVIISHQERILEIADKIVVLTAGEMTDSGTCEEVLPQLLDGADACRYYKGGAVV